MLSEVQNKGAPILFDVRPLIGILGYVAFDHKHIDMKTKVVQHVPRHCCRQALFHATGSAEEQY